MIAPRFGLAIAQFAARPRALEENARRIAAAASSVQADLLVTPELGLTGYDLRDEAAAAALPVQPGRPFPLAPLRDAGELVVGLVEQGAGGVCYNTAVHLQDGRTVFRHRKVYLPTYGMFDEGRYFGRGGRAAAHELGAGWRVGVLICEDLWHPALPYLLASQGIQLLLVLAAAPGRGVWDGGERGGRFASWDAWRRIARSTAQLYGIYVGLANRIGVEGGVTFAGGSLIVGPTGAILATAPEADEAVIEVELSLDEVARARRPFAHARDDDPRFTARELNRLLDGPTG